MNIEDFKKYLKIDKFNLDEELIQQAQLLEEVGDACAEALAELDTLKEELASVNADLDHDFRKQCKKNNERATDKSIENAVQRHPDHQKAFAAYLDAKYKHAKLSNLQEAFVKRSFAVSKLCELYIAGYFQSKSVQGSSSKDRVVYDTRRSQMAAARNERKAK